MNCGLQLNTITLSNVNHKRVFASSHTATAAIWLSSVSP
jgi:hypothetical protein